MADNNNTNSTNSRFGLSRVRELVGGSGSTDSDEEEELSPRAASKSMDGSDAMDLKKPFEFEQPDYDRTEAPKDEMRQYWRQFETTPIIRKPISSFATRVTEPGYYIKTTELSKEEVQKIGEWLGQAAIIEGKPGKDFRLLAKKAIIQREVRGTSLVEVAPDKADENKIAGLKLINPETMEAVTRPTQSILMAPEDIERYGNAPKAETSGAAAWLQDVLETDQTQWGRAIDRGNDEDADNDKKIGFRRDEIIPLNRDADVGEVFGTSRIEAVSDRVDGIKQKLADNEEAIASKAYPLWMFMFGTEDSPWDSSDIQQFMQAQEMENFHPGMKQGVRGDVTVRKISGEVAEIAEYLQFDLRWIMSAMPMPIFVLGAFESASVGQVSGVAQQQDVNRQIKEARRELEEEFTPVVRDVAEQQGVSAERARDITLKFGKPGETEMNVNRNQQVITYKSDSGSGQTRSQSPQQQQQQQQQEGGGQPSTQEQPEMGGDMDNVISEEVTPDDVVIPSGGDVPAGVDDSSNPSVETEVQEQGREKTVWDSARSAEELVHGGSAEEQVSNIAQKVFESAKKRTLDSVEERYSATPKFAASEFETIANSQLNTVVREAKVRQQSKNALQNRLSEVMDSIEGSDQLLTQPNNVSLYAQNIENAIRDATEEMLRKARLQVRRGVVSGASWNEVRERVEEDFGEDYLRERAQLIGHMETKTAIEATKLEEYERSDAIVGFRVSNDNASTQLTQDLHGTEVRFDEVSDISEAVAAQISSEPTQGFRPLPQTPPYHFNDTTTLEPIYKNE